MPEKRRKMERGSSSKHGAESGKGGNANPTIEMAGASSLQNGKNIDNLLRENWCFFTNNF